MAVMLEAEKVSELHQDVKNYLINVDFEKVKNWQKDSYHKQMMGGFKETKEAEEGFKKAQKPWAKKLKEVTKCVYLFIRLCAAEWMHLLYCPADTELNLNYVTCIRLAYYTDWDSLVADSIEMHLKNSNKDIATEHLSSVWTGIVADISKCA